MARSWSPELADAVAPIVAAASAGSLCPVLGAGVSIDIGGKSWAHLLRQVVGITEPSSGQLDPELVFELSLPDEILQPLRECLYPECLHPEWATSEAPEDQGRFYQGALNPLAKLAIETAKRSAGRRFHVVTYNYDTLLEEVIASLGHRPIAVAPVVPGAGVVVPPLSSAADRGMTDYALTPSGASGRFYGREGEDEPVTVRVLHPHGLVRRDGAHTGIVLDHRSYNWTVGATSEPHRLWQVAAFANLDCLFYGLSFKDVVVRGLIQFAHSLQVPLETRRRHLAILYHKEVLPDGRVEKALHDAYGIESFVTESYCQQKVILFRAADRLRR